MAFGHHSAGLLAPISGRTFSDLTYTFLIQLALPLLAWPLLPPSIPQNPFKHPPDTTQTPFWNPSDTLHSIHPQDNLQETLRHTWDTLQTTSTYLLNILQTFFKIWSASKNRKIPHIKLYSGGGGGSHWSSCKNSSLVEFQVVSSVATNVVLVVLWCDNTIIRMHAYIK